MLRFSKQINIISKIKNMVNRGKFTQTFEAGEDITKDFANMIQTSSYNLMKNYKRSNAYTPTYIPLSEQLMVDNLQVFCAAAYNLSIMAINNENYRDDILDIFDKKLNKPDLIKEKKDYLLTRIEKIQSHKN